MLPARSPLSLDVRLAGTRLDEAASTAPSSSLSLPPTPRTPVFDKLATTSGVPPALPSPRAVRVAHLPRAPALPPAPPTRNELASHSAYTPTQGQASTVATSPLPQMQVPPPAPSAGGRGGPGASAAPPHTTPASSTDADAQLDLEDGPLFRAHLAALERRATSLRSALKKLQRALDAQLAALQTSAFARGAVDEALEDLSLGSSTIQSDVLGGLYDRELRSAREGARDEVQREVERGKELVERVKGAVERIKGVEDRRKTFDAESKKYYDELAKYLARGESDVSKVASLDAKQAERLATFRQVRVDFFSFLEGLVESEERAVASWLRAWADLHEGSRPAFDAETHRHDSLAALEGTKPKKRPSGASSKDSWYHVGGLPTYLADAVSVGGSRSPDLLGTSDDGHSTPSASGHSGLSRTNTNGTEPPPATPSTDNARRRRRTSLPHFGLGVAKSDEKDPPASSGKRERLKGFFRAAGTSLLPSSPSTASIADVLAPLRSSSPPPPVPSVPPPPSLALPAPQPATNHAPPRALTSASSQSRKKEGYLFATETGQKHTQAGDNGQRYHRYWVTLSEGRLTEYDRDDVTQVHGAPIDLRYATARMSRQAGERRFVFEVLTPSLRRVYQASGDKECQEWVTAIQRSVESLLNGETPDPPTSPKSRFPPFLSRRASASAAHSRKSSTSAAPAPTASSKRDKHRSFQAHSSTPPVPSLLIGDDGTASFRAGAPVDRSFFDPSSRRGVFAFSESDAPPPPSGAARPQLNGLGIPLPSNPAAAAASKSSPDLGLGRAPSEGPSDSRSRSPSSTCGEFTAAPDYGAEVSEEGASLSAQDRAISDAVRRWASGSDSSTFANVGSSDAPPPAAAAAISPEEVKYRNAQRINAVARRSAPEWDNARCADCRAPEPRWASYSLGVTLCIQCAGVHRSLGTHVSKVRSIELDDWSDEQLERMEAIGNARSNAFFEARLPPNIVNELTDATLAPFIRDKYVERRWTPRDDAGGPTSSLIRPDTAPTAV
ncbi:hypothetical protein Rhopal_005152-T1 [Rhodotorula paludigena]|uniref:Uncharacterized protein n=1 Tax=Rhodotorula paludigena TaxID=86838 RepID=A0AAV5GSX7_9BASI|nr:hypothetical protein Rhopal_005152-T1 [Rhodotorula paludigena]